MKKIFFFIGISFFLLVITNTKALNIYDGNSKERVTISFKDKAVTTRNLKDKLNFDYQIISMQPKLSLSYYDEAITKRIENFNFSDIVEGEKEYIALLRRYGLYDDIEKVNCLGVPLESITIYTKSTNLTNLQYEILKS
mgnify:FL=1